MLVSDYKVIKKSNIKFDFSLKYYLISIMLIIRILLNLYIKYFIKNQFD